MALLPVQQPAEWKPRQLQYRSYLGVGVADRAVNVVAYVTAVVGNSVQLRSRVWCWEIVVGLSMALLPVLQPAEWKPRQLQYRSFPGIGEADREVNGVAFVTAVVGNYVQLRSRVRCWKTILEGVPCWLR